MADRAKECADAARRMISTALRDLERGDRLDAIDALHMAIGYLQQSRAATLHPQEPQA